MVKKEGENWIREVSMMNQLEELVGKDKIRGKPIRLNRRRLVPKKGKEYAEFVPFGDFWRFTLWTSGL